MQPLEAIKKSGTIDVALRVQNYLQSIMREAKRLWLIAINPAYDLEGPLVHAGPSRQGCKAALPGWTSLKKPKAYAVIHLTRQQRTSSVGKVTLRLLAENTEQCIQHQCAYLCPRRL
jgi:hypothetical protein